MLERFHRITWGRRNGKCEWSTALKKKKEKERKKEKFQLGSKHFVDDKEFNMNSECD